MKKIESKSYFDLKKFAQENANYNMNSFQEERLKRLQEQSRQDLLKRLTNNKENKKLGYLLVVLENGMAYDPEGTITRPGQPQVGRKLDSNIGSIITDINLRTSEKEAISMDSCFSGKKEAIFTYSFEESDMHSSYNSELSVKKAILENIKPLPFVGKQGYQSPNKQQY
jgi:hypothetical protein